MASLTSFRVALQEALAADLGIEFVPGKLEGPIENRDLGCVYPAGKATGDIAIEEKVELHARVFLAYDSDRSEVELPWDPTQLEQVGEQIQTSVKTHQKTLGPWFAECVSLEFDMADQGVEAVIVGTQHNVGELQ